MKPIIGITLDNRDNTASSGRYEVGNGYSRCVAEAGGVPVLLPHEPACIGDYLRLCAGFVFTGGVDPDTTAFGQPIHPQARLMDRQRQAFELALYDALDAAADKPVLGVCLGMQLMALRAGGVLDQFMPQTCPPEVVARHKRSEHTVTIDVQNPALPCVTALIHSNHQQAICDAGAMRVIGRSADGVIEAIDDPSRGARFYVGVQWHPERSPGDDPGPLNRGLFARLVKACGRSHASCAPDRG